MPANGKVQLTIVVTRRLKQALDALVYSTNSKSPGTGQRTDRSASIEGLCWQSLNARRLAAAASKKNGRAKAESAACVGPA